MNISGLLEKLMRRENLTVDEAAEAMGAIMSGDATPAQIAALLVGLTMKGERPSEIVGLAKTMRANAVQLSRTFDDVFDTCGTGGDRSGTFNISSAAALVAAAAGLRMAKHGNRSVSSQCGSADVYEALGVNISAAPAIVERSLETVGIAFFFAPTFHPSMRHAAAGQAGARGSHRVQPARAADEPGRRAAPARGRSAFGADRAARAGACCSWDRNARGSCTARTGSTSCRRPGTQRYPSAGTARSRRSTCTRRTSGFRKPSAVTSRRRTQPPTRRSFGSVLAGRKGPRRDVVLLNAGASLFVGGKAASVREGIERAAHAIDSGAAARPSRRWSRPRTRV